MEFTRADVEQTLVDRFRSVARIYADRPALRDGATQLTYAQLDRASDRLAVPITNALKTNADRVVLLLPSGVESVTAFLATGKAGAVCVPLNPKWPVERLLAVIKDIGPAVIIYRSGFDRLPFMPEAGDAVWLDVEPEDALPEVDLPAQPAPAASAVIYYTSGSTGAPKGIVLSHRCILNGVRNYIQHMGISVDDRIAWTSPIAFGASTGPIFSALCSGATVCRFDVGEKGFPAFAEWLENESITVWMTSATLFRSFVATLPERPAFSGLRLIKVGGETVYTSDAYLWQSRFHDGCVLLNGLGITEAGGNVCFYRHDRDSLLPDEKTLPVGYPADGMELLLLDDAGNPVAPGTTGEIAVCSEFLFSGYWLQHELTEKTITELSGRKHPVLLTGDLGRLDGQGRLVHVGRKDHMVKIRGHRIDIPEVESALAELDGVDQAVVVSRKNGDIIQLAAFVVWRPHHAMTRSALRQALSLKLPSYMVPSHFYSLASIPMLPNGKIDREALRKLPGEPLGNGVAASHRNPLEYELIRIMEKSIGMSGMGIHDDYFEMGGDSLSAARMLALIGRRYDVLLPLTVMTHAATPARLAVVIREWRSDIDQTGVILLEPGHDQAPPFFCAPGAGSDAFSLVHLARHIGRVHPFYALQYSGLDGKSEYQDSLQEMAERFIKDIRRIQPQGPYYLGGSSFGGWVAYAIAQQLIKEGENVALLALLDSYGPGYPKLRSHLAWKHRLLLATRWLLPIGRKDTLTRKNIIHGIREKWHIVRIRFRKAVGKNKGPLPFLLRFACLQQNCFQARNRYTPESYPGVMDLFRAETQPTELLYERVDDLGWGGLAVGGLRIHHTPGMHAAHIREPHVSVLASNLLQRMREVRQDDSRLSVGARDHLVRTWDHVADWWDNASGDHGHAATRNVIVPELDRMLGQVEGKTILDIGCGNGWFARHVAVKGARVMAIDFSPRMIERAVARTMTDKVPVEYRILDVTQPDDWKQLVSHRFDAAYAYMVLMDLPEIETLMNAVNRLLSPGGIFAAAMVHPESHGLENAQPGEMLTTINAAHQPGITFYFHRTIDQITRCAESAGLILDELNTLETTDEGNGTNKILAVKWRKP